ncbi:hypothetical protein [Streptomyces sp. NPDC093568]|uniref:hypothetical protein n=1 Tax=Streptomyces sp. NPDC093568 TaxID=3366041 RepID=UPI00381F4D79
MITSRKGPQRAGKRIVSVGVALGIALATGAATAASAAVMTPVHAPAKAKVAQASPGHGEDDDGCVGLIILLCG